MKHALFCLCLLWLPLQVTADIRFRDLEDPDAVKWVEGAVEIPAFPQEPNLREIYVGEATPHRFFVDETTLTTGSDGVVRYVLVVRTQGGATNISFEGIRCEALEYKIYASGRADGSWTRARKSEWRPIENKPMNRQHAALSRDYFCPSRLMIQSPAEGRDALRRGRHPEAS